MRSSRVRRTSVSRAVSGGGHADEEAQATAAAWESHDVATGAGSRWSSPRWAGDQ
jgi:hypothetical protein